MWLKIIFCKSRKTSPSPELPGSTSGSSVPYVQHRETAPAQLPVSTSGVSTPNHGSVIKIGDVVGSTLSNFGNTKIHGEYLMEPPAQLPVLTSCVSAPNHGSSTEITDKVGDVAGSTLSNFGNDKAYEKDEEEREGNFVVEEASSEEERPSEKKSPIQEDKVYKKNDEDEREGNFSVEPEEASSEEELKRPVRMAGSQAIDGRDHLPPGELESMREQQLANNKA